MASPLKYHAGEIAVQKRAHAFDAADLDGNGLRGEFDARAASFLAQQLWAVIAALDLEGRLWVSLLNGAAGFLQVDDSKTLTIHAALAPGDPLDDSISHENEIGVLVLDPRVRRRMRINGRAQRTTEGTLRLKTREVYANCPKYIQRREAFGSVSGERTEPVSTSLFTATHRDWIESADTFFIGSLHAEAGVDCSHRGGNPGFVRVLDERRLAFPDYSGNNMFQTLGNLSLDPRAGLLFLNFETGDTLQLTGTTDTIWDEARLADWPGAQRLVEFEVSETIETRRASPMRWRLMDYSPSNPR